MRVPAGSRTVHGRQQCTRTREYYLTSLCFVVPRSSPDLVPTHDSLPRTNAQSRPGVLRTMSSCADFARDHTTFLPAFRDADYLLHGNIVQKRATLLLKIDSRTSQLERRRTTTSFPGCMRLHDTDQRPRSQGTQAGVAAPSLSVDPYCCAPITGSPTQLFRQQSPHT